MIVRPATGDDLAALDRMARAFAAAHAALLGTAVDFTRVTTCTHHLMDEGALLVLVDEDDTAVGMIGLQVFEHPFTAAKTASEVWWWVDPAYRGHGRKLLTAAEGWATLARCAHLVMVAPDDRVGVLYRRYGYHYVETAWRVALPRVKEAA